MFEDIGGKLKTLARLIFALIFIGGCILGVITILNANDFLTGILMVASGALSGWLSAVGLFAFGQLVENSDRSVHLLEDLERTARKILREQENRSEK